MKAIKLIVGLGNPGAGYAGTRHNVGFEVIDLLARRHRIVIANKRSFKAFLGEGQIGTERVLLAKPMTYMNLSGESVAAILRFYKIAPEDVIVVLDEVALPPGRLRLRYKGSAGGHNGLENVLAMLHTQEVPRLRIGVGESRPGERIGHVLSRFRREEVPVMHEAYERAAEAIEYALSAGFEMAMNRYNVGEPKPAAPEAADKADSSGAASSPATGGPAVGEKERGSGV